MKITFPSSSSSSSHANAALSDPHNPNTCFSGVLRRLLCSGGLQTHPFDCIKDHQGHKVVKIEPAGAASASVSPGVIARLMGLETLPDAQRSRWVKSSSSPFQEMPRFLPHEDDKFLVLSFESLNETNGLKLKHKKSPKPRQNKQKMKAEGEISTCQSALEMRNNKEDNSESSSPVSVLDHLIEFMSEPESPLSEGEDSRLMGSNSRKKLSTNSTSSISITEASGSNLIGKSTMIYPDAAEDEDYLQVWGEVCKLAKEEMQTWSWSTRENSNMEEIRNEFGLQILDQLLHDLVIELGVR